MKIIITLLLAIAVAALGIVGVAYSGLYDVSARTSHTPIVHWLLSTTSDASIEHHAASVAVPDLSREQMVLEGARDFDAMCAGCHGAPGRDRGPVGQGLNPEPPDLGHSAEEMTPAELFWVIENGVKMTGMPAWGVTHGDTELWPIVAFIDELPKLDGPSYERLVARAEAMGHHGSGTTEHQDKEHGTGHRPGG